MTSELKLILPLFVMATKQKRFYINLNNYRNAHFQILNASKKKFKLEVMKALGAIKPLKIKEFEVEYTMYAPDKVRRDLANVLSIVDKYACDALVELNVLEDDNTNCLKKVTFAYGGIDKENPRVEMVVKVLNV